MTIDVPSSWVESGPIIHAFAAVYSGRIVGKPEIMSRFVLLDNCRGRDDHR